MIIIHAVKRNNQSRSRAGGCERTRVFLAAGMGDRFGHHPERGAPSNGEPGEIVKISHSDSHRSGAWSCRSPHRLPTKLGSPVPCSPPIFCVRRMPAFGDSGESERAAAGSSVSWLGSAGSRPIESQPHRRSRSRRRTAFVARPQSPASPLPRYEPRRQFRATAVLLRERVAVCALWGVPLGSLWCSRLLPARCPPVCWFSTIHP